MTLTVTELVLATLAVLVLVALFAAQRYRVAGANEALVISGARGSKVRDEKGDLLTIHDQGVKTVLGKTGPLTWVDVLNQIIAQPQAARFITAKLWTFFASENPSPESARAAMS